LIQPQGRRERGQRQLIDAQGSHQRMVHDSLNERPATDNDAALRSAEQLIAAE
jgi:hypothetical protein